MPGFVAHGESCLLRLDYAWYHVAACLLQATFLWACGRTQHFRLGNAFGLFALVMDYGLMFLTRGTRTISYPDNPARTLDAGIEPLGPVGEFVFFLWFDYSAFGIVVWALALEAFLLDALTNGGVAAAKALGRAEIFGLSFVPLQFWTAPWLSSSLGLDRRELLLTRGVNMCVDVCVDVCRHVCTQR